MIKLVVDSNVFFSSLIKGKKSEVLRKIIFLSSKIKLIAPEELLFELHKHFEKFTSEEVEEVLYILFTQINIIPRGFYKNKISEAYSVAKQFDEKDTPFVALALKLKAPIWTGDKKMIIYGLKRGDLLPSLSDGAFLATGGKTPDSGSFEQTAHLHSRPSWYC